MTNVTGEIVKVFLLPGGTLPQRKSEGAVGYDVCIRAITSFHEKDSGNPHAWKTLFDFVSMPPDPEILTHVERPKNRDNLAYRLNPRESVSVGLGFIVEMPFPVFYELHPRSGYCIRDGIQITDPLTLMNDNVVVDPDYRGESGATVHNLSEKPFFLERGTGIAQIIFRKAVIPEFLLVESPDALSKTNRGRRGLGSTGR